MVFLAGPRQAGKTTLARMIGEGFANHIYFNWDIPSDRVRLIENPAFFETVERKDTSAPLVILDEIHKYRDWKNYLKGTFDRFNKKFRFLVTGSGRLDIYQKGGDSLAGRYFLLHLWPFTLAELSPANNTMDQFLAQPLTLDADNRSELHEIWHTLVTFSGFPEPFLAGRKRAYRRWSTTYGQQLIREDIRDLTQIRAVHDMETLYYLLPSKIGIPLSLPVLSRELKVSYNTVRNWLDVFERFFMVFSLTPWTRKISRAIHKERKVYLWDLPRIKSPAMRFENAVAIELYRAVTVWNDGGYGRFTLHFIKNKEKQEVDFLIADDNTPVLLVEAKLSDTGPAPSLLKFQSALNIPAVQLVNQNQGFRMISNAGKEVLVAPAWQWLGMLPW